MSADEILDDRNFASAVTGFVWVGLWHLVLTMTAILATGAALLYPGPAAFSDLWQEYLLHCSGRHHATDEMVGIVLIACLLFSSSFGLPSIQVVCWTFGNVCCCW